MKNKIFLLFTLFNLLNVSFSYSQGLRKHLAPGQSYGIPFHKPDTVTTLNAFERSDKKKFFTKEILENRLSIASDEFEKEYEKQRIVEGENIFLCFRINDHGMWTRHTYWIHFDKDGTRPVFRQRVYIDYDSTDLSDDNDMLVFQLNYYAFQIFEAVSSDDDVSELKGLKMLEYIEKLISYSFREHADAWIDHSYPEYGIITSHQNGIYYSSYPAFAPGAINQQVYNENHELYLGIRSLETDSSSLYMLFYPIGDVLALHPSGEIWVKYNQFYRTNENFKLKISEDVKFMGDRSYFVGLQGKYSLHSDDGNILDEYYNLNGYRHGAYIMNSEYGGEVTSGKYTVGYITGYINVDMYYYGYLAERISLIKEAEIGIHTSKWESMNDNYMIDAKKIKMAYKDYRKHCRKWKLEKVILDEKK